ncbi:hypothetical protein L6452_39891 [Arctium lappa]|uniref:Uncharacterized protein n=1 Tax=Arctium lappa TaxID=4217 RepID=A0ACB8XTL0_ARCLA|nr:hypothetical protein L6452_39891 [Arctium lappa]
MADSWWDSRTRPCLDSVSVTSMNLFQETTETTATATTTGGDDGGGALCNNTQMMELGLSSQPISQSLGWNQALYRGDQRNDHHQSGYHQTLIQEDHSLSSNTNFQDSQWKLSHKMYSDSPSEFKQINVRSFRLDEPVNYGDENGLNPSFQSMDHSYGSSNVIQSLFGSDNTANQQQDSGYDQNQAMSTYSYQSGYGGISSMSGGGSGGGEYPPPPPQEFSVNSSPPKMQPSNIATQLHFSNNARFWNASAASMNDVRSSFFPLQVQSPSSTNTIEDKPKVRKEKMGDRITALQQLVSPFGKTDTASVLSEAIEYIKFLHEQVNVLSTPYMKNGAVIMQQQQQQICSEKSAEGSRQDLRSRGLCLVPISSTFPVTHETTVDFWTPSFGGTFR